MSSETGEATLLSSGTVRVQDGDLTVQVYDKVSVDHVYQSLFRQHVWASKARTDDTTEPLPYNLRRHLTHPE